MHSSSLWRGLFLTTFCLAFPAFAAKAQDHRCAITALGPFEARAAVDGRSFALHDGREVLLAGIEVPTEGAARVALEGLVAGQPVVLRQVEGVQDRYGRLPAQVFVQQPGAERWVQQELLASGQAQVGTRPGGAACRKALLAAEAPARLSRLGVWENSAYRVMASDDFTGLSGRQNRFTVAEGKVLSVRESAGTIYINFGRVWSRNLTVTILRRNRPAFETAGIDPKKLEGTRVRVRGFVEMRNGPRIDAARPEQIEVAAD